MTPRVSVVVPNFNHARFLAERLESVLGQTFRDFEVLVVDDASTDGSLDVAARFTGDPRVRLLPRATNSGNPFVQWNGGVAATSGEYVWIAEADDAADPRLLATLVARLDARPRVGLAYCQSLTVVEDGRVTGSCADWTEKLAPGRWREDFEGDGRDEVRRWLLRLNPIFNASAVVFRRAVFEAAGGADESLRLAGDWMTWTRMLLRSDVAFVAQPLNRFRQHAATVRRRAGAGGADVEEGYRVVGEALRSLDADDALVDATCEGRMAAWMEFARTSKAPLAVHRRILRAALKVDPRARTRLAAAIAREGLHRAGLLRPLLAAKSRLSSTRGRSRS